MAYTKPYLPLADQIALIQSRGMGISDANKAQDYLERIGYYRLSGYWHPYRQSRVTPNGNTEILDDFRDGSLFSEVIELYVFDKKLRMIVLDAIERVEIALRVQITLCLGKNDPWAHREPDLLHGNFARRPDPKLGGATRHHDWLRRHDEAFDRSKEDFAKHFKTKYAGEHPPIWIAAELLDFGSLSFLYSGMKKSDQNEVARVFDIPNFEIMESWIRAINVARNICAHHTRFWNKASVVQPRWPTAAQSPTLAHLIGNTRAQTRAYGIGIMCAFLLQSINPTSTWTQRYKAVISEFPASTIVNLSSAGFPVDWDKEALWVADGC